MVFYSLGIDGLGEAFADYTALSALYCVLLFGIDGLGKLLPTIRLCMVCCFNGFSWFCGSEAGIRMWADPKEVKSRINGIHHLQAFTV